MDRERTFQEGGVVLVKVFEGTDLEVEFDINDVVKIDKENLSQEFITQAGKYGWFATLLVQARRRKDEAKLTLDVLDAELDGAIRKEATASNTKITEAAIQKIIISSQQYQDAVVHHIKMREEEGIIEAVVRALEQRKDCLISYGSLLKKELDSNIAIFESKK